MCLFYAKQSELCCYLNLRAFRCISYTTPVMIKYVLTWFQCLAHRPQRGNEEGWRSTMHMHVRWTTSSFLIRCNIQNCNAMKFFNCCCWTLNLSFQLTLRPFPMMTAADNLQTVIIKLSLVFFLSQRCTETATKDTLKLKKFIKTLHNVKGQVLGCWSRCVNVFLYVQWQSKCV